MARFRDFAPSWCFFFSLSLVSLDGWEILINDSPSLSSRSAAKVAQSFGCCGCLEANHPAGGVLNDGVKIGVKPFSVDKEILDWDEISFRKKSS